MRLTSIALIGGALLSGAVNVTPAFAGGLSSSATFITPAGFTSTVSAETVLPNGAFYFNGLVAPSNFAPLSFPTPAVLTAGTPTTKAALDNAAVIAVPQFSLQGFSIAVESLSVGSNGFVAILPGSSFTAAAATVLNSAAAAGDPTATGAETFLGTSATRIYNSSNIEFIAAIIKAGAGVNGLD